MPQGRVPWTAVLVPALAGAAAALPCAGFQPDDLFIYLRVVRNVLSGAGWGFNPHVPVNTSTSGAWLLALLGGSAVFGVDPRVGQALGAVAAALGIAGTAWLAGVLANDRRAAWAAGLALALDAWLLRWFWSGMECGLAIAVISGGLAWRATARRGSAGDRAASVVLALTPLVRPEMVLVPLAAGAVELAGVRRHGWRRLAGDAVAFTLVCGAWALFSLTTWGSVLPATAVAKGTLGAANVGMGAALLRVAESIGSTQLVAGLGALLFGAALLRSRGDERDGGDGGRRDAARTIVLALASVTALYAFQHVKVYTRYVLPLSALVAAFGMAAIVVRARTLAPRRALALWSGALALALAWNVALGAAVIVPRTRAYARSMHDAMFPLAERARSETAPGDVVAAFDIGAVGYVTDRTILDLNGLASPEVVPWKREGRIREYLEQHPPALLVEIAPTPGTFAAEPGRLRLRELGRYPFRRMFVEGPETMHMTLYRVTGVAPG